MPISAGKPLFSTALIFLAISLSGCASQPLRAPLLAACEQAFLASDRKIEMAGTQDAGATRINGFRYMRATRFLASYVDLPLDSKQVRAWLNRVRETDMRVRRIELANVEPPTAEANRELQRLGDCGRQLVIADLRDPERIAELRRQVTVPDLYNDSARVFGAYPLAVPFMKLGIARWREQTLKSFAQRRTSEASQAQLIEYTPPAINEKPDSTQIAQWLAESSARNPLSIPHLAPEKLAQVVAVFAPVWQISAKRAYDRIGVPLRDEGGLQVDTAQSVTYVDTAFTRFDGRILLQVSYTVFFPKRPANYVLDPFSGAIDGLVWRVTLGHNGEPLIYDSIHPCGCYHLFFPTRQLQPKNSAGFWEEAATAPLVAPTDADIVLGISSGEHFLQSLTSASTATGAVEYDLQDYDQLRLRGPRRLFDKNGFIPGTERGERWFLWPSGVPNAGAMRQNGRQVTAFVGKRYFDDPYLIGRYFERR